MPVDFKKIKLLVVDMDNTLCDTFHTLSRPQWQFVERQLQRRGWHALARTLKRNFGKHGFLHTLRAAGATAEQQRYAIRQYDKVDVDSLRLFADARFILEIERPKVLITRGEPRLQRRKIRHLGLRKHFDEVIIIGTYGSKETALRKLLARYRLRPSEILVIGDRLEEEIAAARTLRIPSVLVRRPDWPVADCSVKPDLTVRSLAALAKRLRV